MPTPAEKKALVFLAGLAVLGAAVRMTGAAENAQTADAASREALRRQIVAVESAGAVGRRQRGGKGSKNVTGSTRKTAASWPAKEPSGAWNRAAESQVSGPLDVDRATAEELERLPRIGPAVAARIVEDRSARGPFGSLQGLERVRGVGPAMLRELAPHVTFSGTPRPSITDGAVSGASTEAKPRKRRRGAPP